MSGLNNRNIFLTVLETGKSKIRVSANPISGDNAPPGLQTALLAVSSHNTAGREGERERERDCFLKTLPMRTLISLDQSPTFKTSFNLNHCLTPKIVTMGVRNLADKF